MESFNLNHKLSEEQFVEACREFFMHLHNWDLLSYNGNEDKLVHDLPSIEKTRAKLDKEFDPKKGFEPYTQFFTQDQIGMTGCSWVPYACYLADESSFTRVIANGSWSEDPLHEYEVSIDKVMRDFPEPIVQYLVAFNICKSNHNYKPGYDKIDLDFHKFINSLDLATQMYKLMTNLDKYSITSTDYIQKYGQDFMNQVDSKLEFGSYSEFRAKQQLEREQKQAEYNAKLEQEKKARQDSGILSHCEISAEITRAGIQMQKLANSVSKAKIEYQASKLKLYESLLASNPTLFTNTNVQEQLVTLKENFEAKLQEFKNQLSSYTERINKLNQMDKINNLELESSLVKLTESLSKLSEFGQVKDDGLYDTAETAKESGASTFPHPSQFPHPSELKAMVDASFDKLKKSFATLEEAVDKTETTDSTQA